MQRRCLHRCIVWLLPLFVLRAFVPAGYMLASSAGGLQMALCTGAGPATTLASRQVASLHHDHEHQDGGHENSHAGHALSVCAFAMASVAHAPSVACQVLEATVVPLGLVDLPTAPNPTPVAILIDRIRGPPLS